MTNEEYKRVLAAHLFSPETRKAVDRLWRKFLLRNKSLENLLGVDDLLNYFYEKWLSKPSMKQHLEGFSADGRLAMNGCPFQSTAIKNEIIEYLRELREYDCKIEVTPYDETILCGPSEYPNGLAAPTNYDPNRIQFETVVSTIASYNFSVHPQCKILITGEDVLTAQSHSFAFQDDPGSMQWARPSLFYASELLYIPMFVTSDHGSQEKRTAALKKKLNRYHQAGKILKPNQFNNQTINSYIEKVTSNEIEELAHRGPLLVELPILQGGTPVLFLKFDHFGQQNHFIFFLVDRQYEQPSEHPSVNLGKFRLYSFKVDHHSFLKLLAQWSNNISNHPFMSDPGVFDYQILGLNCADTTIADKEMFEGNFSRFKDALLGTIGLLDANIKQHRNSEFNYKDILSFIENFGAQFDEKPIFYCDALSFDTTPDDVSRMYNLGWPISG